MRGNQLIFVENLCDESLTGPQSNKISSWIPLLSPVPTWSTEVGVRRVGVFVGEGWLEHMNRSSESHSNEWKRFQLCRFSLPHHISPRPPLLPCVALSPPPPSRSSCRPTHPIHTLAPVVLACTHVQAIRTTTLLVAKVNGAKLAETKR
jgi:hypothetical protein